MLHFTSKKKKKSRWTDVHWTPANSVSLAFMYMRLKHQVKVEVLLYSCL